MRVLFFLAIFTGLYFLVAPSVQASLVTIKREGEVIVNVLSDEASISLEAPIHSFIEVKRIAEGKQDEKSVVNLARQNGRISLVITSKNETRELSVDGRENDLVEIEERPEIQKVTIGVKDEKFTLVQKGVTALTEYPIEIDAKLAKVSITTSKGKEFLSILPYQAVESALRTKLVSKALKNEVEISEFNGKLQYKVPGQRVFNFLRLIEYSIPMTAFVSPSTGEILSIDSPTWFKYLRFLFI